jgi:TusA-related sulfurtransferase
MALTKADRTIDVCGQICPYPQIIIKETLKKLKPGEVLEVKIDYEPTVRTTIPAFCNKKGYPFEIKQTDKQIWLAKIQKN